MVGPSGAGKSTLLNMLAGFQPVDDGRIVLDGADVTHAPVAARPVSILFQDGNVFPHLNLAENVGLGLRPDLRLSRDNTHAVSESLSQVGLAGMELRRPADLSGGQIARVALARMLLRDRPIALMDEPFAALDPALRREMATLVRELCVARGTTLVLVAHELRGIEDLATTLCLITDGGIVLHGNAKALFADPPTALSAWV